MQGGALAIGIDVRSRDFAAASFAEAVRALRERGDLDVCLLFLDAADEAVQRRFSLTRRRHPLAYDRPVADGLRIERQRLAPLREWAHIVVDTTDLGEPDLRRRVRERFALPSVPGMAIQVVSFSYGRGIPREADLVFDVRFLANPHYVDRLRPKTGEDPEVGAYIEADAQYARFFDSLAALVGPLLPRFQAEGKSYLTLAFGCTGGRHRSVFVAAAFAQWLARAEHRVWLRHRELDQERLLLPNSAKAPSHAVDA
jgi:UPF0042 nucleotide-binding protein